MRANLFWLNDEQWAKIEPLIPMNRPGPKPQNNRRILSGIIHVLKTVAGRTVRRNTAHIRRCTIASIAGAGGEFGSRSSRRWRDRRSRPSRWRWTAPMSKHTVAPAAEKGGLGTGDWCHQGWPEQQASCACRQVMPTVGDHSDARQRRRLHGGAGVRELDGRHQEAAWR